MSRKQELEDALDLDLVKRAATAFIREQIDAALKERLPQLLRAEPRRPAQVAGGAPSGDMYLTRQQAAQITGYSPRTIARLIDQKKLRACGPRHDRITRFEIDRMMAKRDEVGAEETGVDAVDPDAEVKAEALRLFGDK